jgi:Ca-activated chloride channel family protein
MSRWLRFLGVIGAILWVIPAVLPAQTIVIDQDVIIIPPRPRPTPVPTPISADYKIRSVDLQASIRDQQATVQVAQVFQNTGSRQLEATLCFPLPTEAAISGLTLMVDGKELPGKLMDKDAARRLYESIVRKSRDPALLEYMGHGLFQTSVFPIPPNAERKVEIRYSQLLRKDSGLIDLLVPLGTNKHSSKPVETLTATIRVEASEEIKTIYSPTHKVDISRPDDKHAICKLTLTDVQSPDDFRLLYGTKNGLVGMNVLSYRPDPKEDGYFLLLASPEIKSAGQKVDKTVVIAVDRSGSMSGKKIEQAKEALKFVIQQLRPNDTFNIIAYDSAIETFRPELQKADEATVKAALGFADGLFAGGSTNIDGALQAAFKLLNDKSRPSYVLFLTDGLPTVGETKELTIAEHAQTANTVGARLFTFGVGFDVNSRLLDRLAREERGASIYVRPNENIETHVAELATKISAPLLTDISINIEFDEHRSASEPAAISRTYPKQLTDLFQGEQLVYVGRYKPSGTAKVTLAGTTGGEKRTFTFPAVFTPHSTTETDGFVEKLWATRRVGEIIDELDLKGQNQELIDELVQLSVKHGILTPYTSFLANERTDLAQRVENSREARDEVSKKLSIAGGQAGFAQRESKGKLQTATAPQATARAYNAPRGAVTFEDAEGKPQIVEGVRNLGQKTFFRRDNRWKDSTVTPEQEKQAIRIVQFSPEYFDLAATRGGQMSKYLAFNEPVLLNLDGKIYQIDPPQD